MKAVLTIDLDKMPKNCGDCLLVMDFRETHCIACMGINDTVPNNANDGIIGSYLDPEKFPDSEIEEIYERKPDWCPLKKLPEPEENLTAEDAKRLKAQNLNVNYHEGYTTGWNECLKEITGA